MAEQKLKWLIKLMLRMPQFLSTFVLYITLPFLTGMDQPPRSIWMNDLDLDLNLWYLTSLLHNFIFLKTNTKLLFLSQLNLQILISQCWSLHSPLFSLYSTIHQLAGRHRTQNRLNKRGCGIQRFAVSDSNSKPRIRNIHALTTYSLIVCICKGIHKISIQKFC